MLPFILCFILFCFSNAFADSHNANITKIESQDIYNVNHGLVRDDVPFFQEGNKTRIRRDQNGFELLGRWGKSSCRSIELRDSLLIYSNGSTVFITDKSNPDEYVLLSSILLPAPVTDLAVTEDIIYAVVFKYGIYSIDYSDLESPQIVDSSDVFWGYLASLDNNYLAVSAFAIPEDDQESPYGFRLFDISDPSNIRETATIYVEEGSSFKRIADILIEDEQCLIIDKEYGVRIFDISDPTEPSEVAGIDLLYGDNVTLCKSFQKNNDLLYISGFGMLHVYDISNTDDIQVVSITNGNGNLSAICDTILYTNANSSMGIIIWDISSPDEPQTLYSSDLDGPDWELYGGCTQLDTDGSTLYWAGGSNGLYTIDVTDKEQPNPRYRQQDGAYIKSVVVEDDLVMCYANKRMFSIDYNNQYELQPGNIDYEFEVENENNWDTKSIVGIDGYYYLFSSNDFKIIDATDQDSICEVSMIHFDYLGSLEIPVEIIDDRMYITSVQNFAIWDVSDPRDPVELGVYRQLGYTTGITISDNRAYLFQGSTVKVIDINDPTDCSEIAEFQVLGNVLGAFVEDNLLYTASGYTREGISRGAFTVTDITDIENTRILDSCYLENVIFWNLVKKGDTVFLSGDFAGVFAFDVSDPASLNLADHYDICALEVILNDSLLFVLGTYDIYNDLAVLRYDESHNVFERNNDTILSDMELDVYPNPGNSEITIDFYICDPGNVALDIFDLTGRQIASVIQSKLDRGYHKRSWSVQNIPTGIYMLRLHTDKVDEKRKIIIIK